MAKKVKLNLTQKAMRKAGLLGGGLSVPLVHRGLAMIKKDIAPDMQNLIAMGIGAVGDTAAQYLGVNMPVVDAVADGMFAVAGTAYVAGKLPAQVQEFMGIAGTPNGDTIEGYGDEDMLIAGTNLDTIEDNLMTSGTLEGTVGSTF